jgi:hypothetical protein
MFGSLLFGQYWTEDVIVATGGFPDPGGGAEKKRKRKRKTEEPDVWPQPWQNPPAKKPETPQSVPAIAGANPRPTAVVVPALTPTPETVAALAGPLREIRILDPKIAAEARALQMRLQRELEDEEILFLLGFFD